MNFYLDGKYSVFEELMHYYHINFNVYYILVLIVLVNCIKAIVSFYSIKKTKGIKHFFKQYGLDFKYIS